MFARICICLAALAVATPAQARFAEHAAIDAAIERFTGAPAGAQGGAKTLVDRRMRLAACQRALSVQYHGNRVDTLAVACPDPGSWRIFVALNVSSGPAATFSPAKQEIVARGDLVSIEVSGPGFAVQQAGEALEAGGEGEWIRVRPAGAKEPLRARIMRPGLVAIAR